LKTLARELPVYKLDLVGEQMVMWDSSGAEPADGYTIFYVNISK
jgi:hypothetical protein